MEVPLLLIGVTHSRIFVFSTAVSHRLAEVRRLRAPHLSAQTQMAKQTKSDVGKVRNRKNGVAADKVAVFQR